MGLHIETQANSRYLPLGPPSRTKGPLRGAPLVPSSGFSPSVGFRCSFSLPNKALMIL